MHGLDVYDPDVVQGTVLSRGEIDRQIELYRRATRRDAAPSSGSSPSAPTSSSREPASSARSWRSSAHVADGERSGPAPRTAGGAIGGAAALVAATAEPGSAPTPVRAARGSGRLLAPADLVPAAPEDAHHLAHVVCVAGIRALVEVGVEAGDRIGEPAHAAKEQCAVPAVVGLRGFDHREQLHDPERCGPLPVREMDAPDVAQDPREESREPTDGASRDGTARARRASDGEAPRQSSGVSVSGRRPPDR